MSRSEFRPDDSPPDSAHTLEQHIRAGFPPDLALDLVLNELVVRAAKATRATSAALALLRGDEMVCRATTGHLAPDLGIPLSTRDGLSGACLQTRQPQLSVDTEFDPRVDPAIFHRLGIRSILIVPVFGSSSDDEKAQFTGVLEVFSTAPVAFSDSDQRLLEGFAKECARIRLDAFELSPHKPIAAAGVLSEIALPRITEAEPEVFRRQLAGREFVPTVPPPVPRPPYAALTLLLGGVAILAIIAVSFLIGYRMGWLRPTASPAQIAQILPDDSAPVEPAKAGAKTKSAKAKSVAKSASPRPAKSSAAAATGDDLVVYEKGKVIFRLKPSPVGPDLSKRPANPDSANAEAVVQASSTTKMATATAGSAKPSSAKTGSAHGVWLSPEDAEERLLDRTEPQYPPQALAAHRSGAVVLEVQVAEDGSVSSVRTLSGDPLLAAAAAEAVRNWRYQPYRRNDHPAQFQTDVTLSFTLPN